MPLQPPQPFYELPDNLSPYPDRVLELSSDVAAIAPSTILSFAST